MPQTLESVDQCDGVRREVRDLLQSHLEYSLAESWAVNHFSMVLQGLQLASKLQNDWEVSRSAQQIHQGGVSTPRSPGKLILHGVIKKLQPVTGGDYELTRFDHKISFGPGTSNQRRLAIQEFQITQGGLRLPVRVDRWQSKIAFQEDPERGLQLVLSIDQRRNYKQVQQCRNPPSWPEAISSRIVPNLGIGLDRRLAYGPCHTEGPISQTRRIYLSRRGKGLLQVDVIEQRHWRRQGQPWRNAVRYIFNSDNLFCKKIPLAEGH